MPTAHAPATGTPRGDEELLQALLLEALVVGKALLLRLQAADVAEGRERIRRLEGSSAHRASLADALRDVEDPGALRAHLDDLHVEIVPTMHPSDATRRAVIHKLLLIAEQLDDLDRVRGDEACVHARADLAETVAAWWATDEVRRSRPPVEEEVCRTPDEAMRQPLLTTMAGVAAGVQSVGGSFTSDYSDDLS